MVIVLTSCRSENDGFSIAIAQEPPSLDVMVNTSISGREILVGNVFEKLFSYDGSNVIPLLASSYEFSEDSKTLRITIKDRVYFHDGSELDAEDVAASMNRWLRYSSAAVRITEESIFEAEGNSIVIRNDKPLTLLPLLIATASESAVIYRAEDIPEDGIVNTTIGTGPYRIDDYRLGEKIVLIVNDEYYGTKPLIEKLSYYFVSDPVTRRSGLESGTYDFIDTVSSDDIPRLEKTAGIKLVGGAENGSIALLFNKREGISTALDFRKGVSFAINRDSLMKSCYGEYGYNIDSSYMERGTAWHSDSSLDPYGKENHKEADNLLSAFSGETVRILSSNLTGLDRIAVTLASQLEAKGLKAELVILDWAAFLERRKNPESWDIAITALTAVPLPLDKAFLSPDYPGWTDTDAYYILDDLVLAESDEIAENIWQEAQMEYWEYIPAIVLGHYSTTHAAKDNVRNIGITSNGFSFLSAEVD